MTVIRDLIDQYNSLNSELRGAIRREDGAKVDELDGQVSAAFDQILLHKPADLDERLLLAAFLVDFLENLIRPSPLALAVKDKILKLVRN